MISAHLATIPDREMLLKQVLASVTPHVDHTFVALNGYSHVPTWLSEFPTMTSGVFDNSLGDAFKFAFINEVSGLVYVLDDDLYYTPEFFSLLQKKVAQYGCPVSLHGKKYPPHPKGFKYFSENYRCLNTVNGDHRVDVAGTGVLCFDTSMVKIPMDAFKLPNMADIYFSKWCFEHKIPLMVVEHRAGIVGYLSPKTTIWGMTKNYAPHDALIKSFLK